MGLRIILQQDDAAMAANVGGAVNTTFKTLLVEVPEVEAWLSVRTGPYVERKIVGIEIVATTQGEKTNG